MAWTYFHFNSKEFQCRCGCGVGSQIEHIDKELLEKLCAIREHVGPMIITSGARCPRHNQEEGGRPHSAHRTVPGETLCRAVDVQCTNTIARGELLKLAFQQFSRVGLAKTFIHMDVAKGEQYAPVAAWYY